MDIVKAMPQGLQSDIASNTKHIERAARYLIGIPIIVYTPEELKSAMFAFAGGNVVTIVEMIFLMNWALEIQL